MSLLFLLALPFIGSAVAAVLPTNARTTAATGAALVAFVALLQVLLLMPDIQNGKVIEETLRWVPSIGLNFSVRMDVLGPGHRHRHVGGAVRALLHVQRGPGPTLFLVLFGLHGRHAGRGAVG